MGETPTGTRSLWQIGRAFLRDALVGAALGAVLALVWLVFFWLVGGASRVLYNFGTRKIEFGSSGETGVTIPREDLSGGNLWRGCLVLFVLTVVVIVGSIVGAWIGGRTGGVVGGVVAYLAPFLGYGVYVQRATGWVAWLDSVNRGDRPGGPPR
jgi:hypothetical protein